MASQSDERIGEVRQIIDASSYMTLATADAAGRPWATPVWFAHDRYSDYLWVSRPDSRHSTNVAARPETGIVIFDSTAPVGGAQAVYIEARAEQVPEARIEWLLTIYSAAHEAEVGGGWQLSAVAVTRSPASSATSTSARPRPRELPVTNHTLDIEPPA